MHAFGKGASNRNFSCRAQSDEIIIFAGNTSASDSGQQDKSEGRIKGGGVGTVRMERVKCRGADCCAVTESIAEQYELLANKSLSRKSDYCVTLLVENERNPQ